MFIIKISYYSVASICYWSLSSYSIKNVKFIKSRCEL